MKELENMEEAFNQFSDYLDEKILKHRHETSGRSDCCGAPVYDDIIVCSDCMDHCEYGDKLCGYCGDELYNSQSDDDSLEFCSDDCWKGYKWETFEKD
tara:strand:+ start:875 stop:1168 length:294 start_codon:yes stop_codon:yes gene_type:complete